MPGWVIVAFGPNAANVHHIPGDARLKEGDAILIDMGSPRKGYHSDMTRTFFWKSVGEKQRAVYELVKNANIAAEKAIRPGMKCNDVDKVARDLITEGGYGPYFTHRLGHYPRRGSPRSRPILPGTIPIRWNPPWPSPVSRVSTCGRVRRAGGGSGHRHRGRLRDPQQRQQGTGDPRPVNQIKKPPLRAAFFIWSQRTPLQSARCPPPYLRSR